MFGLLCNVQFMYLAIEHTVLSGQTVFVQVPAVCKLQGLVPALAVEVITHP